MVGSVERDSSNLVTVGEYMENWTSFYDIYLKRTAIKLGISEERIERVVSRARGLAELEWKTDMAPALKEALDSTRLPMRRYTPSPK